MVQLATIWQVWLEPNIYADLAIADAVISLLAAIGVLIIAVLEQSRRFHSLHIVHVYLAFSLTRDLIEFGAQSNCSSMRNCHLIKIRVCLEGIWLLWDSYIKEVVIHQLSRSSSASEEASGVLGRIFFWWIHPVLKKGIKLFSILRIYLKLIANFCQKFASTSSIVYLGMAVSGPTYQHQINRLRVMTRGALISLVHHQSLHMSTTGFKDSEAPTLVSSDIDNIESFGETFHETWARLLEVIIGTMLLAAQIGWFAFLPLVIVFAFRRHAEGLECGHTQKRLATVAAALGGIKSLKMMGMEDAVQSLISYLRSEEIGSSKRLRWILVTNNASANALGIFAPVLTLILYALTLENGGVLRADEVFTSVALLTMVTHPANMVMTLIPQAIAIMANFDRVQSYVSQPSIQDKREYSAESNVRKLASIQNVSITSPSTSLTLLLDVCIDLNRGEIIICAGAVGRGKTILAMAILGEAHLTTGTIRVSSKEIAYCSQEPWLPSVTIRDAISGGGLDLDLEWYNTVIDACGLVPDFTTFARGDMTLIEDNGINLSGGQKQRIALARAVYSRHRILVLDDPFSAIDEKTVDCIIDRLLSTRGLLKRMATTVFLITNSRKLDSFADKFLVLQDSCIHLRDPSSFEDTEDSSAPSISIDTDNLKSELIETPKPKGVNHRIKDAADDITRATGDIAVYGAASLSPENYICVVNFKQGSGSQALTENVRHVKIFPSTGQALSMTPKDNTLGKCIRDTIPRAVPTLPSKPRTYGNGTRSSLASTETVLNVRRN
ncbi:lipid A export ATP-binding/permease protein msbA, putative [Talaromyces marneffei ATCC 18224]|nr:lipid A export ATP-binding/permease protein msbA, putative [Talaromyces marneffei ATCC 18224]